MLTILVDENIDGFAEYLARFLFSGEWRAISSALEIRVATFNDLSLAKGTSDERIWDYCQDNHCYLITDNRNEDTPDSLETTIRARNLPTSLPVFTISDVDRFRSERE